MRLATIPNRSIARSLQILQKSFRPFQPFWKVWNRHENVLKARQVKLLVLILELDFKLKPGVVMREEEIVSLNVLLINHYAAYQNWVRQRFIDRFVRLVGLSCFEAKCGTEFAKLDLEPEIKCILIKLDTKTADAFFEKGAQAWRQARRFFKLLMVLKDLENCYRIVNKKSKPKQGLRQGPAQYKRGLAKRLSFGSARPGV